MMLGVRVNSIEGQSLFTVVRPTSQINCCQGKLRELASTSFYRVDIADRLVLEREKQPHKYSR